MRGRRCAGCLRRASAGSRVHLRPGIGTPRALDGRSSSPRRRGGRRPARRTSRPRGALLRRQRALLPAGRSRRGARARARGARPDRPPPPALRAALRGPAGLAAPSCSSTSTPRGDAYRVDGASRADAERCRAHSPGLDAAASDRAARALALRAPLGRAAGGAGAPDLTRPATARRGSPGRSSSTRGLLAWWNAFGRRRDRRAAAAENRVAQRSERRGLGDRSVRAREAAQRLGEAGTFYLVDTSKLMYDPTSDPPAPARPRRRHQRARRARTSRRPATRPRSRRCSSSPPASAARGRACRRLGGVRHRGRPTTTYLATHARNSIDGAGGSILGVVRLGARLSRTRSGSSGVGAMFFGDGLPFARALDVVGHELTHGVVDCHSATHLPESGRARRTGVRRHHRRDGRRPTPEAPRRIRLLGADLGVVIRNMAEPCGARYRLRLRTPTG